MLGHFVSFKEAQNMAKNTIGKFFGFIFGLVLVLGAAVGIYFGVKNVNKKEVNPEDPEDPEIIIPVEPDYSYTDAEKASLSDAARKAMGIDYQEGQEPERGTQEYYDYQVKLAVADSMPEIFDKNNVSNEALSKVVEYFYDGNINVGADFDKLLWITTEKYNDELDATINISIFEVVNQATTLLNQFAKINEYENFGLSEDKLANVMADVIGEMLSARADRLKDFHRIYTDDVAEATKNYERAKDKFFKKYCNQNEMPTAFDEDVANSLVNKFLNVIYDEKFISEVENDYFLDWKEEFCSFANGYGIIYLLAAEALNNGSTNMTQVREYVQNHYASAVEQAPEYELSTDINNYPEYPIALCLFYEDYYDAQFKNDTSTKKETVVSGLVREVLTKYQYATTHTLYTLAQNVSSFKDYVIKVAKSNFEFKTDEDRAFYKLYAMVEEYRSLYNKECGELDYEDFAMNIAQLASCVYNENDIGNITIQNSSDMYSFLQDMGLSIGLTQVFMSEDYMNFVNILEEMLANYEVRLYVRMDQNSQSSYYYNPLTHANDPEPVDPNAQPADPNAQPEEKPGRYELELKAFANAVIEEFRSDASAMYEYQNDLLAALFNVYNNEVSKLTTKIYTQIKPVVAKVFAVEAKVATVGLQISSLLDTTEFKDLVAGIASGEYDHEYVAAHIGGKVRETATNLKSKLSKNGILIDMTEEEVRDAVEQTIIYPIRSIFSLAYSLGLTDLDSVEDPEAMSMDIMEALGGMREDPLSLAGLLYPVLKIAEEVPTYASRFIGAYNQLYAGLISALDCIAEYAETEDDYFTSDYVTDLFMALVLDLKEEKELIESGELYEEHEQPIVLGKHLKETLADARLPLVVLKVFVAFADGAGLSEPEYRNYLIEGETEIPSKEEQYIEANHNFFDLAALILKVFNQAKSGDIPGVIDFLTNASKIVDTESGEKSTVLDEAIAEAHDMEVQLVHMLFIFTELFDTVDQMDFVTEDLDEEGKVITRGLTYDELFAQLISDKVRELLTSTLIQEGSEGELEFAIGDGEPQVYKYEIIIGENNEIEMRVWLKSITNPTEQDYLKIDADGMFAALEDELMSYFNQEIAGMVSGMFDEIPDTIGMFIDMALERYVAIIFDFPIPFYTTDEFTAVLVDYVKAFADGKDLLAQLKDYILLYILEGKLPQYTESHFQEGNGGSGQNSGQNDNQYLNEFQNNYYIWDDYEVAIYLRDHISMWTDYAGYSNSRNGCYDFLNEYTNWDDWRINDFLDSYYYGTIVK